jgi:ribosomal protein S6--L-glutamate ligase
MAKQKLLQIGWEEWISLPELGLPVIKAKIDTGAKTSAIHAFMVEKVIEGNETKVRFGIHPIPNQPEIEIYCKAHLVDEREVTSSNGQTELRYVIRTMVQFGRKKWPIEMTLTDRETMAYRMLIGRTAMEGKLNVVPGKSCLLGVGDLSVYDSHIKRKKKKKLKICILSRARDSYTTDRLASVAESRGHSVEVINTTRCYVDISAKPTLHYRGKILPRYDAVIPRIGPSITFYGVAILRQFESLGTFCVNGSSAIAHSRDRLFTHQLLGRAGVALPTTTFAHSPDDIKGMIRLVGGAPLVIKLLDASAKKSVILAPTNKAAEAVMEAFRGLEADFITQEYIKKGSGKDIRCFVLGNKVVAAYGREIFEKEDFNVDLPKKSKPIKLKLSEQKMAVRAVRTLGLKFALVNLFRTPEGPRIVDVNATPSLRGAEEILNIDIAELIIEYVEVHARPRLPKRVVGYHI